MPLSEHEQKMLEEMEHALANEDPRFASHMRSAPGSAARRRRLLFGALGLLVGLGLIFTGIQTTMWVGAAGFAVMVAGAVYALSPVTERDESGGGKKDRKRRRTRKEHRFMDRLDQRWERRQHDR